MEEPAATPDAEPVRLLYIDDDEAFGVLLRRNLGRRGFVVTQALDSRSGLAILDETGADIVALDHYLTGEIGLDILPEIVGRKDHPPVVYVTGAGETSIAVEALKRGADDYMTKAVSSDFFELLAASLTQALERARFRQDAARAHEAVRHERDRAELLLREVNHRVANSLALVSSLVRMQASVVTDPAAVAALQETHVRINAIGNVHRHLHIAPQVGMVEMRVYMTGLLGDLQSSMQGGTRPHDISLSIDEIALPTEKAVSLGLIASELVTNAYKYAYAPGQRGEIRVRLVCHSANDAELIIEDDGAGFDPAVPARGTGLGSRILKAMAMTMNATLVYENGLPSGTRASVRFPLRV